ncbi:carboxylesterase [Rhyzopertha dominica]|nr:carboxylesterase [Rhyzopertha dominica]
MLSVIFKSFVSLLLLNSLGCGALFGKSTRNAQKIVWKQNLFGIRGHSLRKTTSRSSEEPQQAKPWSEIWQANELYTCMQRSYLPDAQEDIIGSEDCLYINVYVPREQPSTNDSLNVIVHIHGGAFMHGSGHYVTKPDYIMDREFIFVTFNYRLGALGFLSTQDDVVPGNNGLKDQVLALKWVSTHITAFGGNRNSITLDGFSAGGASVHYHYLSPLSKGLFHRGYSHSGNALCPWAYQRVPLEKFRRLATSLDCYKTNGPLKPVVDCLKKRSARDIVQSQAQFVFAGIIPLAPFGPVAEKISKGAFLSDLPYQLLKKGKINKVPWINSYTENDFAFFAALFERDVDKIDTCWKTWANYLLEFDKTVAENDKACVAMKVRKFYFGKEKISKDTMPVLGTVLNDRLLVNDALKSYFIQSKHAPVYNIVYNYKSKITLSAFFFRSDVDYGVVHGDDVTLTFASVSNARLSESDMKMKNILLDVLESFANTSTPQVNGVLWDQKVSSDLVSYVYIKTPDHVAFSADKCHEEKLKFWDSLPIQENEKLI